MLYIYGAFCSNTYKTWEILNSVSIIIYHLLFVNNSNPVVLCLESQMKYHFALGFLIKLWVSFLRGNYSDKNRPSTRAFAFWFWRKSWKVLLLGSHLTLLARFLLSQRLHKNKILSSKSNGILGNNTHYHCCFWIKQVKELDVFLAYQLYRQ